MIAWPLVRYIAKAVVRDRLIMVMLGLMLMAGVLSIVLSGATLMEQRQFSMASLASSIRLVAVIGMVVFISFFQRRAHDYREIDYLLATPLGRYRYLFSIAFAFILLSLFLAVVMGMVVMLLQRQVNEALLYWMASSFVELSLTVTFTLFLSMRLRSATVCAMLSLAFYTLARLLGAVLGVIDSPILEDMKYVEFFKQAVNFIAVFIPRFDLLAQSQWLIYGQVEGVTPLLLAGQWTAFTALFLACAAFDLRRNQF